MKQFLMVLTILAVGLVAFGFDSDANAQVDTPLYPGNGGNGGNGRGPAAGDGTGVPVEQNINLDGLLDDIMAAYIADGLGISAEDLKAREAAGETLVEIGLSLGFDADTVLVLHDQARIYALNQAVIDGLITQEQADWLLSRLDNGQYGNATSVCTGDCSQPVRQNSRMNQRSNTGACLYTAP